MPLQRRSSSGAPLELDQYHQLEEILEQRQEEEEGLEGDALIPACVAPKEFGCLKGLTRIEEGQLRSAVKLVCSNQTCRISPFMHSECFENWEDMIVNYLKSTGRARGWNDKQRSQNLWSKRGTELTYKVCPCNCLKGHLRKDLDWEPPMAGGQQGGPPSTDSEGEKSRRRRTRKNSKCGKPTLTIGLPTLALNSQMSMKRSDAQGIPSLARIRTSSLSSNSDFSSSPAASPPSDSDSSMPPRRHNDRSRHDSGGSIFLRRSDYSSFNVLPKHKINSYHIKMEDECSIGNDETRCFILSNYATNKMNRVPCVLCAGLMNIFERYPLIDGTFFLSPRQHTKSCIQVRIDGKINYLTAVCMGCLEGWTTSLHCRYCLSIWDGSQLILGTMYSYDIFAAVPCCADRLKCTACNQLVIHPDQRFNFFSDYSQTCSCPHCGVQDFHFTKPIHSFVSREELAKVAAVNPNMARSWAAAVRS